MRSSTVLLVSLSALTFASCTSRLGIWQITDINDGDVMVGYRTEATTTHAVRYRANGPLEDLARLPDATESKATAVTTDGTIVGISFDPSGATPVLWNPSGAIQAIPKIRDLGGEATAANDLGLVVGDSGNDPSDGVAWVYDKTTGQIDELPVPEEYQGAIPTSINNSGEIVGHAYKTSPSLTFYAARWSAGTRAFSLMPQPSSPPLPSKALGVNASGTVVGQIDGRAVVWAPGAQPVFLPTGACGAEGKAVAINDSGVVVGQLQGEINGCDATPTEAGSYQEGTTRPPPTFAVKWNPGSAPIDIGPPYSDVSSINNSGTAAGYGDFGALRWPAASN